MAIHSLNSLEMPLLASAFSSVLPHVIFGQPTGRECATQLANCQQLPWCPAHGHTSNVASPTKKPIVIVAVDVKKIQTTKKTRGSDMVAKDMMKQL